MHGRSTKQRRAAMRRRQKPLTFAAINDALRATFAGRDLSPLVYPGGSLLVPVRLDSLSHAYYAPPKEPK